MSAKCQTEKNQKNIIQAENSLESIGTSHSFMIFAVPCMSGKCQTRKSSSSATPCCKFVRRELLLKKIRMDIRSPTITT